MTTFLDTDICVSILRGKDRECEARLSELPILSVEIPSVVAAELWVGLHKAEHPMRAREKLERFLAELQTTAFDEAAARHYGEIRARLEKRGISIGANDLLIAAQVISRGGKLITRNLGEYVRIPELVLETW